MRDLTTLFLGSVTLTVATRSQWESLVPVRVTLTDLVYTLLVPCLCMQGALLGETRIAISLKRVATGLSHEQGSKRGNAVRPRSDL